MPDPFITTQDLTDYLGRDVTLDDGAVLVLDAACDIVRDISEQSFNAGTATVALDGSGTDALLLPERPVTAAGTVLVNGTEITDYMATADGRLLRGTAGADPRSVWPSGRQNISVTYEFGYASVDLPRSVRMVALSVASRLVVQGVAKRETLGDVTVEYSTAATDLTENEQRILRRYRKARSF